MKKKMEDFDANVFASLVTFLTSKKNVCAFMLHDGHCILFFLVNTQFMHPQCILLCD